MFQKKPKSNQIFRLLLYEKLYPRAVKISPIGHIDWDNQSSTWSSSNKVYSTTPSNVDHAKLVQEAVLGPQPVSRQAVDDRVDQGEEAIGVEVAPAHSHV